MSKFFDTNGIPTERGLRAFFEAADEAESDRAWREAMREEPELLERWLPDRELEIKAKRKIEFAVRTANHVHRNIHTGASQRALEELSNAAQALEDAACLLNRRKAGRKS